MAVVYGSRKLGSEHLLQAAQQLQAMLVEFAQAEACHSYLCPGEE